MSTNYTEDNIRSLDWREHIRKRPGMYIGKLGDGTEADDGIYVLIKEIIDNSVDEFSMGQGHTIEITIEDSEVSIRDYGRGIPLGKVVACVAEMNTGGKYDNKAFKRSVGLNGVGAKAVNALSEHFMVRSVRDEQYKEVHFEYGYSTNETDIQPTDEPNGTLITFKPDDKVFKGFEFNLDFIREMVWNYAYLNTGLTLKLNGEAITSSRGLFDLLSNKTTKDLNLYDIIHLKDNDIEVAFTHVKNLYTETYFSFVNSQNTPQGGTHLNAFKESIVKTIRDFYEKNYDPADIRQSVVAAISIKVENPVFESQTKTKLGSQTMGEDQQTIRSFVNDFIKSKLELHLHKHPEVAKSLQEKILATEKERKELSGIRKLARQRAKKASLHNRKLRDCKQHLNDKRSKEKLQTSIFITEGDSASGSITTSRNVQTQAVFSLKGKPLNAYGLHKKVVYENEEFNLLQAALNIEESLEDLRYNKVIIATDADVDGMHIRLLLITFFIQFFPELVRDGHVYILQTPLFRVRSKDKTIYCYDDDEREKAISSFGRKHAEVTRFKGLGEISPQEFKLFIGKDIRLEKVLLDFGDSYDKILEFYMGKNTPSRQSFIIENLRVEAPAVDIF